MDRVPPHDEDAEVAVLGGMIQDPDQVEPVRALLGRRDFYRPAHGHVFEAILEEHAARWMLWEDTPPPDEVLAEIMTFITCALRPSGEPK